MILLKTIFAILAIPFAVLAIVACGIACFIGHMIITNRRCASLDDFEEDTLWVKGKVVNLDFHEYKLSGN